MRFRSWGIVVVVAVFSGGCQFGHLNYTPSPEEQERATRRAIHSLVENGWVAACTRGAITTSRCGEGIERIVLTRREDDPLENWSLVKDETSGTNPAVVRCVESLSLLIEALAADMEYAIHRDGVRSGAASPIELDAVRAQRNAAMDEFNMYRTAHELSVDPTTDALVVPPNLLRAVASNPDCRQLHVGLAAG